MPALRRFYTEARREIPATSEVSVLLADLEAELEHPSSLAGKHATFAGRVFDSSFAARLIDRPPVGVLTASRHMGSVVFALLEDAEMRAPAVAPPLLTLASLVRDDYRPWFSRCPTVDAFLAQPNIQTAREMLRTVEHGYDAAKIQYLAVRSGWTLQAASAEPEWLRKADLYFRHVVGPERSTRSYMRGQVTRRPGIMLQHQASGGLSQRDFVEAKSWADDKFVDFDRLSTFERSSLERGHPIVNGASGSSNILSFFHHDLAARDPRFSSDDAFLAAVMFLVYDGGHSVHEVAAVRAMVSGAARSVRPDVTADDFAARRAALQTFELDYRELLPPEAASSPAVADALRHALDQTIASVRSSKSRAEALAGG